MKKISAAILAGIISVCLLGACGNSPSEAYTVDEFIELMAPVGPAMAEAMANAEPTDDFSELINKTASDSFYEIGFREGQKFTVEGKLDSVNPSGETVSIYLSSADGKDDQAFIGSAEDCGWVEDLEKGTDIKLSCKIVTFKVGDNKYLDIRCEKVLKPEKPKD